MKKKIKEMQESKQTSPFNLGTFSKLFFKNIVHV